MDVNYHVIRNVIPIILSYTHDKINLQIYVSHTRPAYYWILFVIYVAVYWYIFTLKISITVCSYKKKKLYLLIQVKNRI